MFHSKLLGICIATALAIGLPLSSSPQVPIPGASSTPLNGMMLDGMQGINLVDSGTNPLQIEDGQLITQSGIGTTESGSYAAPYQIIAVHSGKCLDVIDASLEDNAIVQQFTCHDGDNQKWTVVSPRNARPNFNSLIARHSHKCLDIAGESMENGAVIQQYTCHFNENQQWRLWRARSSDNYVIQSRSSGKCLDIADSSEDDHAAVQQFTCHGRTNQQFRLELASSSYEP